MSPEKPRNPPKSPLAPGTTGDWDVPDVGIDVGRSLPSVPPEPHEHPAVRGGVHITERTVTRFYRGQDVPERPSQPVLPPQTIVPEALVPVPFEAPEPSLPTSITASALERFSIEFEKPFAPPTRDELAWVETRRLGSNVGVVEAADLGRVRIASHIGVLVLPSVYDPTTGKRTVYVRVRFFPDPGKDWERKLRAESRKRLGQLVFAVKTALIALPQPIPPGFVVRFAGGQPMSEADARMSGYQVWTKAERAPVRCEYSLEYLDAMRRDVLERYHSVQNGSIKGWFTRAWWRLCSDARWASYRLGEDYVKNRVKHEDSALRRILASAKLREPLERAAALMATPVVQSLVSMVWFGNRSDLRKQLEARGISVGDERGTRLGTMVDGPSELYDDADDPHNPR